MNLIKIAIADAHQLFREGLRLILDYYKNFKVIYDVENGEELLTKLGVEIPDVILMDLKMSCLNGINATQQIKAKYPQIKIIILTQQNDEDVILHMLNMGANSYLLKNTSCQEEIHKAVTEVCSKGYYFSEYISNVMLGGLKKKRKLKPPTLDENQAQLTKRECEVLKLICQEYTTPEIAEKLFTSERTIESHRKSLLEKLKARNTAGLIIKAFKAQIITEEYFLNLSDNLN